MKKNSKNLLNILMFLIGLIWLLPVVFGVMNSFKPMKEVLTAPMDVPKSFYIQNYIEIWNQIEYPRLFLNSVIVVVISEAAIIVLSAMAGFWLQRHETFKGAGVLRNYFMLSLFIPFQAIMVSMVSVFTKLRLTESYWGLILSNIGLSSSMAIFLYYGFARQLPKELDEAAAVDGAGTVKTFFKIIFPLMSPMTSTVVILTALNLWNEYLRPLLLVQNKAYTTLPVGTASVIYGQFLARHNLAVTALVMAALPMILLFLFLQKYIVTGVVNGAVKG